MLQHTSALTNQAEQGASIVDSELFVVGAFTIGIAAGIAGSVYAYSKIRSKETPSKRAQREADKAAANTIVDHAISHKGRELILSELFANVKIETSPDATDMQIAINGKQRFIDDIQVAPTRDALHLTSTKKNIESPLPEKWWPKLVARWLKIDLETTDKRDILELVATVPTGSSLTVKGIDGYVSAKGEYGKTSIAAAYAHQVAVDGVTEATIKASSNSRVQIGSVNGHVAVDAGYSSSVIIESGKATSLHANLSSNSELDFDAPTDGLDLSAGYRSKARIRRACGEVAMRLNSNSQAIVESGHASSVRIDAGYQSSGCFHGHADEATLRFSSNSDAQLGSVTNLDAHLGYSSGAKVLWGNINSIVIHTSSNSELDLKGTVRNGTIVAAYGSKVAAGHFDRAVHIDADQSSKIIERG